MPTSNLECMKAYLEAVEAMGSYESVAQFNAPGRGACVEAKN